MQNIIVILVTLGSFAFGYFVVYRFGLFLDARGKMMDEAAEKLGAAGAIDAGKRSVEEKAPHLPPLYQPVSSEYNLPKHQTPKYRMRRRANAFQRHTGYSGALEKFVLY